MDNKLDTDMSTFELGLYFPDGKCEEFASFHRNPCEFSNYKSDLDPKDDTLFVTLGIESGVSLSQGIITEAGPTGRPIIGIFSNI